MKEFKIVPIPPKMEKYYGTGTILHPSLSEIEELVRQIPERKVTTINHLTHYLAKTHDTDTTCPLRTGNAIKKNSNTIQPGKLRPKSAILASIAQ